MKTKKKAFDCVEMKRKGSLRVMQETKGMTLAEELAYWQVRGKALDRRIQAAKKKLKAANRKKRAVGSK